MNSLYTTFFSHYYLHGLVDFFKNQLWLLYGLIIIMGAIIITYGIHLLQQKPYKNWLKREHLLLKILIKTLYWPAIIFIWVEVIAINLSLVMDNLNLSIPKVIDKLHKISLLMLIASIFIKFIKMFEKELLKGTFKGEATDQTTIQALGKVLRVAAFIIVALLLLSILGIEITAIVAFASGSAIIVGIAAQQVISNYFGGIVVHSDGHFRVGDWIYSPDKQLEGVVEYIGWRSTHIRTLDCRMLYVPNATFSSIIVINASRMTHRRIKEIIHIRYEDAPMLEKIIAEINAMLQAHPSLDKTRRLAIYFNEFGPFSINLMLYAFTPIVDWQLYVNVQQAIYLNVLNIITKHGAQIAIPNTVTTTV